MGGGGQGQSVTGGGGGSGGATLDTLANVLNNIWLLLLGVFGVAGSQPYTEFFSITTTAAVFYGTAKPVKRAFIQNIGANPVGLLITQAAIGGKTQNPSFDTNVIILNPQGATHQAGGSIPLGNIDLSCITALTQTSTSTVAVYYEV